MAQTGKVESTVAEEREAPSDPLCFPLARHGGSLLEMFAQRQGLEGRLETTRQLS